MSGEAAWVVHKFGGSSVADAACLRRVADIVEARTGERSAVVLSACRGVTDALYALVSLAEQRGDIDSAISDLRERHTGIASELLSAEAVARYGDELDSDLRDIRGVQHTVQLTRTAAPNVRDLVAGYGEIWSSKLFAYFLRERGRSRATPVAWVDARKVIVVDQGPLGPMVDWARSRESLAQVIDAGAETLLVITGFVASDKQGAQTTLGRNGSDFSASIFGSLLGAREICIWTDVDGVLSADPRRVPGATVIDSLSYNEAMELAYFGAKVIHPQTMGPAIADAIPIRILNTFAPEGSGTLICANPQSTLPVKGITSIEGVAMIDLEGAGMIGVPGTAHRLFGALRQADVSVILISQGSSEHSICCAIPEAQAERAAAVVRDAFDRELRTGQIQDVTIDRDLAILAIVGDGMAGMPGVAAKLFSALGRAGVNVRAIAQGASERNISAVVDAASTTRALRAAHASFYLSPHTLSIGVIGPGSVGSVFLDQLASQSARLREEFNLDFRVRAIASSKQMALFDRGAALSDWRGERDSAGSTLDIDKFIDHVRAEHLPHSVIIDCSASEDVARRYVQFFERGIHVVTANKKAHSADYAYFQDMAKARQASGAHYLYETTVGAGLPVVRTTRELRETGDEITSIEGIFSGTLAYLFNVYDGSAPFSAVVRDAKERGYTEPDPRDDLSGMDVARKLIILAREMGLALELSDVVVESLAPKALQDVGVEEFMEKLPEHDAAMRERLEAARARGKVLRHVGRVTAAGEARVGVVELDASAPLANTALTDNIVRYSTRRYSANPLIVQGPGAGPEVTAGGVFADLLRLASYLGARM
ncbi:bifunctional aspartate kinase/homoserine dehydrogenase I [Terricaulis silvestris]|uniref:Aspartokinase n=1 Tax=Terricaulis silvestris TaxID=2686094 RepID=A0A6I6MPK9_9CAUL|nr:bifunctional aspartate kinase/homoserine dehydrogenase I [Terricaulis silvestris]QGZ96091.1 Aspartokinase I/homoserine dehydrogenase I [Terricaulis silvestris]